MRFSQGLLVGSWHMSIRTPSSRFAFLLCILIQLRTAWERCHEALSQITSRAFFPSLANCLNTQLRNFVVRLDTGLPPTNRSQIFSISARNNPYQHPALGSGSVLSAVCSTSRNGSASAQLYSGG